MKRNLEPYEICDHLLDDMLRSNDSVDRDKVKNKYLRIGIKLSQLDSAFKQLGEDNYAEKRPQGRIYDLTPSGKEWAATGAYYGHKSDQEQERIERQFDRMQERELRDSVMTTNDLVRNSLKTQQIISILALIVAGLAIILTILQMVV